MPRQKSQHVDDPRNVGRRLREARTAAGLSQRALSFPGCTPAYISRIEAGERIPSLQLLREFGRRLGVSADYLATGSDEPDEAARLVEADVALRLDDLALAQRLYEEALERPATREFERRAHAGLGQVAFARGDARKAIEHLETAGCAESFDRPCESETLGRAYAAIDDSERAIALAETGLAETTRRNDPVGGVRFSVLLADTLVSGGSLERAKDVLAGALAALDGSLGTLTRARLYWSQSRVQAQQENAAAASEYARRALELLELGEDTRSLALAHRLLASIELEDGNAAAALDLLKRGGGLLRQRDGATVDLARFQLEEARALAELGQDDEAVTLASETVTLLRQADAADAGPAYEGLGRVFERLGDRGRARELYELAIESLERHGSPVATDAYVRLADLLKAEGKKDEALELLERAVMARSPARPR